VSERLSRATSRSDGTDGGDGVRAWPGDSVPVPAPPPDSRSRLRAFIVAEAVAVLLGYVVSSLREGPPATPFQWTLIVVGAVAVAIPFAIKSRRELRQEAAAARAEAIAIDMDARLRLIVGDVTAPIAEVVGRVHQARTPAERSSLGGQLLQLVVEAAANLCDGVRTRACFFQLDHGAMAPVAWTGRSDAPTTVFTDAAGDRRGQEALLLVRFHDFLLVDDVLSEPLPPGVEARPGASYRSFISVAVFCGEQTFGMLTVDAPEPAAFDETDLNVMRALAQLLGAGLVGGQPSWQG
jgi:GAF domain-containing protein